MNNKPIYPNFNKITFEQKMNRSNLSKEDKEKAKMYMRDIARFKKSFEQGYHDFAQLHDASA